MSKEAVFLGDSLERLKAFPAEARISMGHAIGVAQEGGKVTYAKPLKGIGGGGAAVIIATSKADIDIVKDRLKKAIQLAKQEG